MEMLNTMECSRVVTYLWTGGAHSSHDGVREGPKRGRRLSDRQQRGRKYHR
jgi:hypothetical protein